MYGMVLGPAPGPFHTNGFTHSLGMVLGPGAGPTTIPYEWVNPFVWNVREASLMDIPIKWVYPIVSVPRKAFGQVADDNVIKTGLNKGGCMTNGYKWVHPFVSIQWIRMDAPIRIHSVDSTRSLCLSTISSIFNEIAVPVDDLVGVQRDRCACRRSRRFSTRSLCLSTISSKRLQGQKAIQVSGPPLSLKLPSTMTSTTS